MCTSLGRPMMMIRRRPTATRSYVRSYSARDTSWNSVGKAELSTLASFLPRDASCLFVDTSSNDYIPPSFSFSAPPTPSPRTLLDIARDVTSGRFKDSNGRLLICSIFFIFSLSLSYSFDSNYLNIKETRRHNTVFLFFLFFTETETRIRLNISLYREKINSTPFYSCDFHIARGNIFTTRFGRDCLEFRYKLHSSLNLSRMIRFKAVAG